MASGREDYNTGQITGVGGSICCSLSRITCAE